MPLIEYAAEIAGKVGENLRGELPILQLSRKLATIETNVPLDIGPEDLRCGSADTGRLRELYARLEFRLLLKALDGEAPAPEASRGRHERTAAATLPGWPRAAASGRRAPAPRPCPPPSAATT